MSTIYTYRHSPNVAGDAAGTLVDTEVDADEGAFAVTVDSTGWSAGSYTITCKREDTANGYSVSEHSNELALTVGTGGWTDDFNRGPAATVAATGKPWLVLNSYWGNTINAINASNQATAGMAYWNDTAPTNFYVQAKLSPWAAGGNNASLYGRWLDPNPSGSTGFYVTREDNGSGASRLMVRRMVTDTATELIAFDAAGKDDAYVRMEVSGTLATTQVKLFTSTDGTTWTQRGATANDTTAPAAVSSGLIGIGVSGTGWLDDFGAGAAP